MNNGNSGVKYCQTASMNLTDQVRILKIHEEPIIKSSYLFQHFHPQKHKTPREIWTIPNLIVPHEMHFILLISALDPRFRKQSPRKDIHRSRQQLTQSLWRTIWIDNIGHYRSHLRRLVHEPHQSINIPCLENNIRVKDDMVLSSQSDGFLYSNIVCSSIPHIALPMNICQFCRLMSRHLCFQIIGWRIVHHKYRCNRTLQSRIQNGMQLLNRCFV